MKNIKFILVACFMCVVTMVNAQSSNDDWKVWKGVRVSYNSVGFTTTSDSDFDNIMGLEAGYVQSFGYESGLMIELGGSFSWIFGDLVDQKEYTTSLSMLSLTAFANVNFNIKISDNFSLIPYVGFYGRAGITGKLKTEIGEDSSNADIFDDDEMGGDAWKRFFAGPQLGVNAKYKNYIIGASRQSDFNDIAKDTNMGFWKFTVGYNF